MNLSLIDTGYFLADGGAMFGAVPKSAWTKRYPSNASNGCVLAMRTALLSDGKGRHILIDNGAGDKHLKQLSYYNFFDLTDLGDELLKRNVHPAQITDVVLTHLHFDHCGYTTRKEADGPMRLSFPKATHWISRAQWENAHHPHPLEQDSFFTENVDALAETGLLRLIDTDTSLCEEVELRLYGGHTPGQIAPYIRTEAGTVVFAGDVIPLAAHLSPGWISAYDAFPLTSYNEKLRMLDEAAKEKQAIIYCHDAYIQCSTVKKTGDFYKTERIITRF